MDTFNLETFVKEPTLRIINVLKKSQLLEVANYYKLEVNNSRKKSEIKQLQTSQLSRSHLETQGFKPFLKFSRSRTNFKPFLKVKYLLSLSD